MAPAQCKTAGIVVKGFSLLSIIIGHYYWALLLSIFVGYFFGWFY